MTSVARQPSGQAALGGDQPPRQQNKTGASAERPTRDRDEGAHGLTVRQRAGARKVNARTGVTQ